MAAKSKKSTTKNSAGGRTRRVKAERTFLGPELGAASPVDGSVGTLDLRLALADPGLKALGAEIMQKTREEFAETPASGESGNNSELNMNMGSALSTSSTIEEIEQYYARLQQTADFLEAQIEEVYNDLELVEEYLSRSGRLRE